MFIVETKSWNGMTWVGRWQTYRSFKNQGDALHVAFALRQDPSSEVISRVTEDGHRTVATYA